MSSHLDAKIRDHILGGAQCAHWEQKGRLTHESIQKVNWHTCEEAMSSLSIGKRYWIAKHISGHAGIGTKMVQWQFRDSAACPGVDRRKIVIMCGHVMPLMLDGYGHNISLNWTPG